MGGSFDTLAHLMKIKKYSLRVIKSVTAASLRRWSDRYIFQIVFNRVGLGYP